MCIRDSDKVVIDIFDGDLNFLKPKGGNKLNSDWTDGFTNPEINKKLRNEDDEVIGTTNPKDIQGFGITAISIKVDSSYIPSVQHRCYTTPMDYINNKHLKAIYDEYYTEVKSAIRLHMS